MYTRSVTDTRNHVCLTVLLTYRIKKLVFDNLSSRPCVFELSKSSNTGLFANTGHNRCVELGVQEHKSTFYRNGWSEVDSLEWMEEMDGVRKIWRNQRSEWMECDGLAGIVGVRWIRWNGWRKMGGMDGINGMR